MSKTLHAGARRAFCLLDSWTKKQNRVFIDIAISKMEELFVPFFVHFLCISTVPYFEPLLCEKYFWSFLCQNIVFRADPNYINEMQINWESFVIIRDKKSHVEIRVFLMICLLDFF